MGSMSASAPRTIIARERQARALELRKQGWPHQSIADDLDVTEGALRTMLTKAGRAQSDRAVEEFNRQKALARAVARMDDVADVHPLDALLEAVQTAAAMAAGLRELVGELEPGYSSSGEGVAGPDHLGDGRP